MFWVDWVLQYELLIFSAARSSNPLQIESNSGNLHRNFLVFAVWAGHCQSTQVRAMDMLDHIL